MTKLTSPAPVEIDSFDEAYIKKLTASVQRRAPLDAADVLGKESDDVIGKVLSRLNPTLALKILLRFPQEQSEAVAPEITSRLAEQWSLNQSYPEDSVGRLMEQPVGIFGMHMTVRETVKRIRELVKEALFTYVYVIDDEGRLQGVVVMRDLLLARPDELLSEIMLPEPFYFLPQTSVTEAMRAMVHRHYPVYPVCDDAGRLIGLVQGYVLFEEHAFEISAQPGRMVGVEKEERLTSAWRTCLNLRHPWLQLNLLTAFMAAFVVGLFENTIERVVALAVFLPVLAGQSGNTGCQALAVTLRGMTLGELKQGLIKRIVTKEAVLGFFNGTLVGVTAAAGMFVYATINDNSEALALASVVFLAMIGSCVTSGVSGVLVPITLKRLGTDPATASSIFLTTATDVASMGLFLGLATLIIL